MALEVDPLKAGQVLRESYERVNNHPQDSCKISSVIDFAMTGKGCLTYRYILLTALVAKLANPSIDMMSLQVEDPSPGAYAPRTLCMNVIFPFQKNVLFNALDGNNPDPLVNNPARFLRLSKKNAAKGDGKKTLMRLCDALPSLTDETDIREALDYMMTELLVIAKENERRQAAVGSFVEAADAQKLREFLSDLLDQSFGGSALVLVAYALFLIQFPAKDGFEIIPHPVNQSGASSRQRSDLDIELNGEPFLGIELKDKPFVSDDVSRAADVAKASGLKSLLFVSGRHAGITSIPSYFFDVKAEYAKKQVNVGIIQIDELMDFVLVTHPHGIDATRILSAVYDCVSAIGGTVETQTWVYSRLSKMT